MNLDPGILDRILRPLANRLFRLIARGVIRRVDDTGTVQLVQASYLAGEDIDRQERVIQYGLASVPPEGSECVTVFPNGNRDHGLVLGTLDRKHRAAGLEPGEVALYTQENAQAPGHRIVLRQGGAVEIHCRTFTLKAEDEIVLETRQLKLQKAP